jgi:hypothetical protein
MAAASVCSANSAEELELTLMGYTRTAGEGLWQVAVRALRWRYECVARAVDCEIATEAPDVAATLLWRVKAAVDRLGKRGLLAGSGKPVRWAVKP